MKKSAFSIFFFLFFLVGCASSNKVIEPYKTGALAIIQGATSDSVTTFNVLIPRLKKKYYAAVVYERGVLPPKDQSDLKKEIYIKPKSHNFITDEKGLAHWAIKKFVFEGLDKDKEYLLGVVDTGYYFGMVDEREFKTLNLEGNQVRFALGSCMTDAYSYKHVRDRIWNQLFAAEPEFVILSGDLIYVDGFDKVARESATDFDIWQRFIDSVQAIPFYSSRRLIPLFATWDDHDMVTNNSHKRTVNKEKALKTFRAFFGAEKIPGVYEPGGLGVSSYLKLRGQQFFFMDGRFYREEPGLDRKTGLVKNKERGFKDPKTGEYFPKLSQYAHWGKRQHNWLINGIGKSKVPTWIVNGDQFFGETYLVERTGRDGKKWMKRVNESLMGDHPRHFEKLMADLKQNNDVPVVFASGDIHFSEVMKIEKEKMGYETYEITSSPVHSYMFKGSELWPNSRRVVGKRAHNFVMIDSKATSSGSLELDVKSIGMNGETVFELKGLKVQTGMGLP